MKVSHLLAMTTIVLLSSCSANGKQSDATNQEIKAEAETEEVTAVTFKGDLGQFALRGPVKEFSTPIGVHECFDRDGFLLDTETGKKKESDENNTVKRNEQGRIVRIDVLWNDSFETYDYDERGLLVKNYWEQFGRKVTKNYEYNEKGECLKMTFIETGGRDDGTFVTEYKILERDRYGNWIRRIGANGDEETQTITYYE